MFYTTALPFAASGTAEASQESRHHQDARFREPGAHDTDDPGFETEVQRY